MSKLSPKNYKAAKKLMENNGKKNLQAKLRVQRLRARRKGRDSRSINNIYERLLQLLVDLEKTQQITTEMLPRIPPPVYENQLNVFVLIEYHFGYPIRMDIDQFNDTDTLCNSEAD